MKRHSLSLLEGGIFVLLGGAGVIIDSHLFGNGLIRGKDFFGSTFDSLLTKNCNIKDRKELEPFFRLLCVFVLFLFGFM